MIKTVIKKDLYKDSVSLMILNNEINAHPAVEVASIMMASPANKEMFEGNGLLTPEVEEAGANDVAIAIKLEDESAWDEIIDLIEAGLEDTSVDTGGSESKNVDNWDDALAKLPDANLAIISTPGIYAASVARRAINEDLNVMIFSDNVTYEDEKSLKTAAKNKGLFVMGPDAGTSIIQGVPLAFANKVKQGKIGLVGASGTGLQEVISVLDSKGVGITHAIGTGGRDLDEKIGAITFLKGIQTLMEDDNTEVILTVSKPPAPEVLELVENYLMNSTKPVASLFQGIIPTNHYEDFYQADTLEELALLGIDLLENKEPVVMKDEFEPKDKNGTIKGLFAGGTLAGEAALLIERALGIEHVDEEDGYMLKHDGFEIIDLGDDKYTQGKPHPMIDPSARVPFIKKAAEDETTKAILLDIVIGYNANIDPASTIKDVVEEVQRDGLEIIATICGTEGDIQGLESQRNALEDMGVKVFRSNRQATEYALSLVGYTVDYPVKSIEPKKDVEVTIDNGPASTILEERLKVINIGLPGFADALEEVDVDYVQYDFRPVAGGDVELIDMLDFLDEWRA